MPVLDPESRAIMLRCMVGPDRAAIAPDSWLVRLFNDDPEAGGTEISDETETEGGPVPNGYAAPTVYADDFAVDGEELSVVATLAAPSEAWETATHWVLEDPVTGFRGPYAELVEPLEVDGTGGAFDLTVTVFFEDLEEE